MSFLLGVAAGVLVILAVERIRDMNHESLSTLEDSIEEKLSRLEAQTQPA